MCSTELQPSFTDIAFSKHCESSNETNGLVQEVSCEPEKMSNESNYYNGKVQGVVD